VVARRGAATDTRATFPQDLFRFLSRRPIQCSRAAIADSEHGIENMKTIIFVAVEAMPLDRLELGEAAIVSDLLRILESRGVDTAELLIFKEGHDEPLEHHHPLHGHENPVFHAHRCRRIEVTVHYKTEAFHDHFAPSTTVARLTHWAVQKARLGKEEAEEHVLQISGTRIQPPLSAHLGSLVTRGCTATFDLVRKKLVQG
jgi:hypothetical protein